MNFPSGSLTAVLAGLGGAAHCAAMCGPLTLALGSPELSGGQPNLKVALAFNAGRLASYGLAGACAAWLSLSMPQTLGLASLAVGLRLLAGILLSLMGLGLLGLGWIHSAEKTLAPAWRAIRGAVAPLVRIALSAPPTARPFLFGLLWLFIPCSLVLSMLLVAATQASAPAGALFMLVFGLGTTPAVISLSLAGTRLSQWLQRPALRRTLGVLLVLFGLATGLVAVQHGAEGPDMHMHHHPLM